MRSLAFLISVLGLGMIHHARSEDGPSPEAIRSSLEKSLPLLETASRSSADQRKCFTCHNQGLPILAFVEARKRGFEIDAENLKRQVEHTAAHLKRGKSSDLKGNGQGGKADTAGSAVWALNAGKYQRDEITDAVISFLLQWDRDTPYWEAQSKRPPSEGSPFTSTFLALRGFDGYAYDETLDAIERRRKAARDWLIESRPETTEDHVFRLRALDLIDAGKPDIEDAARQLVDRQRSDGGWAQLEKLDSDAYATGSALVALNETRQLEAHSKNYRQGLKFLIDTQEKDGSWHVVSRSRPIQEFYESGFPHEGDQFISGSASAWATLALLGALPVKSESVPRPEVAP